MNNASLSMCVRPLHTFLATAWLRSPRPSLTDPIATPETARSARLRGRPGGIGTAIPRAATLLVVLAATSHAATPAQLCQSAKNKLAGAYAECRQKVEAKFAVIGDDAARTQALQRCLVKFNAKWPAVESKAGGACPSQNDQGAIQGVTDAHTTDVAAALAGGTLPGCPADLAACQGDLGTCNGILTSSQEALATTQVSLAICTNDLEVCLAAPQSPRLKTGQTTCYDPAGAVVPCAGTGQDGEFQKGLARAYVDNGDGTITDTKTGLMWERQAANGTLHDAANVYSWANAFAVKIAGLNAGGGFAGYTDWRLPNRAELESLVDLGAVYPSVSPAFYTSCTVPCSLATCSCTVSGFYWSSTTSPNIPSYAQGVSFVDGVVFGVSKTGSVASVRGVRGGS